MAGDPEAASRARVGGPSILLEARGLVKRYVSGRYAGRPAAIVRALDGVDLTILSDSILALIGESGSGKSTLAMCLACLESPDAGEVVFGGQNLPALSAARLLPFRERIQLVFQDSSSALDPRWTAAELVAEPLAIRRRGTKRERARRAADLMEQVGLPRRWMDRRPLEFSGGQRQRIAIARALALEPELLILDEAFAGLDLSIQAQILNLLLDLQAARGLSLLLISHDMRLVASVADEIAVLHRGKIVETGSARQLRESPRHPLTRFLAAAADSPVPA